MATITCLECGGKVSDKAQTCPHCGVSRGALEDIYRSIFKKKEGGAIHPQPTFEAPSSPVRVLLTFFLLPPLGALALYALIVHLNLDWILVIGAAAIGLVMVFGSLAFLVEYWKPILSISLLFLCLYLAFRIVVWISKWGVGLFGIS